MKAKKTKYDGTIHIRCDQGGYYFVTKGLDGKVATESRRFQRVKEFLTKVKSFTDARNFEVKFETFMRMDIWRSLNKNERQLT